jgi:hypothetical protein
LTLLAAAYTSGGDSLDSGHILILLACGVAILLGFIPIVLYVRALWEGERIGGLRSTRISSMTAGAVVLTGVVEPAWAVATSPFGRSPSVWYDATSTIHGHKNAAMTIFHESNAVPFVLNDGTGRVLVLARRARWDAATDTIADSTGANDEAAVAEGSSEAAVARLLDRTLREPPPALARERNDEFSQEQIEAGGEERCVLAGERVTVIGRAIRRSQASLSEEDACPDTGESLGLEGEYVVESRGFITGLSVLAGTPYEVAKRARLRLFVAFAGATTVVAAAVVIVSLRTP